VLFGASVALFAVSGVAVHAGELLVVAGLFHLARVPWRDTFHQLRPALLFLVPIFLFHVFLTDWVLGLETVLRIVILLLLAVLAFVALFTALTAACAVFPPLQTPLPAPIIVQNIGVMLADVARRASVEGNGAVDVEFDPQVREPESHRGAHLLVPAQCSRLHRLAHRLLDLALRGDSDLLQELADLQVEYVFVHRFARARP